MAALAIATGGAFVGTYSPAQRPAPELTIELTAERVERGRYLVENVTGCMQCHTDRDWTLYGGPAKPEAWLGGGECTSEEDSFPGTMCISNLTPDEETGLGRWSDGEILRALREGVDRDGRALFPMILLRVLPHADRRPAPAAAGKGLRRRTRVRGPLRNGALGQPDAPRHRHGLAVARRVHRHFQGLCRRGLRPDQGRSKRQHADALGRLRTDDRGRPRGDL